jgi:sulfur-oxidizing protein SoxY
MRPKTEFERRQLLITGGAALALAGLIGQARSALAQGAPAAATVPAEEAPPPAWERELRRILGEAKPVDRKFTFEAPETAENGNVVPYSIAVDSPMAAGDYVRAVHVLATSDPLPLIASYRFTPQSGRAQVSSRMRLLKSQDVIAVAQLGEGTFAVVRRNIKVNIGCCGN